MIEDRGVTEFNRLAAGLLDYGERTNPGRPRPIAVGCLLPSPMSWNGATRTSSSP